MAARIRRTSHYTKLNSTTQDLICDAITRGITKKTDLAALADVTPSTINTWLDWAVDPTHTHHLPAKRLKQAMELARAKRKLYLMGQMERVGGDDWRMWAQQLKWLDPEEYGDKNNVNLSGEVKTSDGLTDDQRIAALARIFDAARKRTSLLIDGGIEPVETDSEGGTTQPAGDVA